MTGQLRTVAIRRRWGWALEAHCDHCGKVHHHGGGDGAEPLYGHRAAHCGKPGSPYAEDGYVLLPA